MANLALNQDYVRAGYRIGGLGRIALIPELPIDFWSSYTDLTPLSGYSKHLGESQTQASITFTPLTISLSYRNGRREDTAQRDETWKLQVGFKPKN